MAGYLRSVFGGAKELQGNLGTTLPASWYQSAAISDLEHRAIFSKKWIMLTHMTRFAKIGDFIRYQMSNFDIFLIKGKDGELRAFHNICRHRAFPVIGAKLEGEGRPLTEAGNTQIISCKYHGWSYGINGNLAKATSFDGLADFDAKKNGLWPVHLHLDRWGWVYVNLDSSTAPVSWESQFVKNNGHERMGHLPMEDFSYALSWSFPDCKFNWKTLADNYNECYHCGTAHPAVAQVSNLTAYKVEAEGGLILHYSTPKADESTAVCSQYIWPSTALTLAKTYTYTMRLVPTGPDTCSLEYEVFRHKDATDEEFDKMHAFVTKFQTEDKFLCTNAQRNLNNGVYTSGPLHPTRENGVLAFQSLTRQALKEHYDEEESAGHRVFPAKIGNSKAHADEAFCSMVDTCKGDSAALEW